MVSKSLIVFKGTKEFPWGGFASDSKGQAIFQMQIPESQLL